MPKQAPFGSWKSPITTDLITGSSISLLEACVDGADIYWIESRPLESMVWSNLPLNTPFNPY